MSNSAAVKWRAHCAACLYLVALIPSLAAAAPVYQPPSSNLTYGDVTHGQRVMSASSNPAAAAADLARGGGRAATGTHISASAGIEYGNVQELFDVIDELSAWFAPSPPQPGAPPPGQKPDEKPPNGIDIGKIIDSLDPDLRATLEIVANEVATQAALLGLIAAEGYGKAFIAADAPVVIGREMLGGAWTVGVNWSGTSKAFGIAEPINFDFDAALAALEASFDLMPGDPPEVFDLTGGVFMWVDPNTDNVRIRFVNDSALVTKAAQTIELNAGYSRQVWPTAAGTLFLGGEAKYYKMRLSRISVRFGDITDSDELFDAIRNSDFRDDSGFGLDLGALWVADNYQLGAQITDINEPTFRFPRGDLSRFTNSLILSRLAADEKYTMERQLKLEASLFSTNRRWTANMGLDANAVPDPMGDDFQWFTLSAGYATDSWWLPGVRLGFRKNLAGTEIGYLAAGVTAFKIVNFDIASSIETVKISGTRLPQGLMASIGFQIAF
ncbi:MAG: conjugal transfer protein TraF [Gammaproteobacteria bacterium]